MVALKQYAHIYHPPAFKVVRVDGSKPAQLLNQFVRPCPMTPRHGFVDSRFIVTEEEATQIINETLAADKEAEFLLMKKIKSSHSAIWTPGLMVIGPDNDGATTGRDSFPLPVGGDYLKSTYAITQHANVKSAPYVELLWQASQIKPTAIAVQLRDGPKLPQQIDYVTKAVKVTNVIVAQGDLLEWESKMKNQPEGTVIYHPGGSLASHYSVHAVLNNIPVMVSREPKLGEVIEPSTATVPNIDMAAVRRGFYFGLTANVDMHSACYMMLAGTHNAVLWKGRYDVLLGAAMGFCYRLSITAALGEWRHRPTASEKVRSVPRETVYKRCWDKTYKVSRIYLKSLRDFRVLNWGNKVGGEKWFDFTKWAGIIRNELLEGNFVTAMEAMNKAVNAAHNNGWGFNKFAANEAMTQVANNPVYALKFCGPIVYTILKAGGQEQADKWFARTKPLKVSKEHADAWLTNCVIPLQEAGVAQCKMVELADGTKALTVLCKHTVNSKPVGKHTIPIHPSMLETLQQILSKPYHTQACFLGEPEWWFTLMRVTAGWAIYDKTGFKKLTLKQIQEAA